LLFITTSRRPAVRTRIFIKELERVIPGTKRVIRGKKSIEDLQRLLFINGVSRLVIVENKKGNPWALHFYKFDFFKLKIVCTLYIRGVSLQVDVKKKRFVSFLEIEDQCLDETSKIVYSLLKDFIPESGFVKRHTGVKAFLRIKCRNSEYILSFEDEDGNRIYPIIRICGVKVYDQ